MGTTGRLLLAVGLAAAAASLVAAPPVSASTGATGPVHAVTATMKIHGFDTDVAKAHGYEIRTAPDGRQYSVKIGSSDTLTPDNTVEGDCGISYIYEYGIGNRAVELYTGFQINWPGYYFYWRVRLDDRGGSSYKTWSGAIPDFGGTVWQVDVVVGGLTRGGARASVLSPQSIAVLDNGGVCYSGGPYDDTTIT